MNDFAGPLTLTFTRDGEPLSYSATVADIHAVAGATFEIAQHYGSGSYVALHDGEPVYELTHGYLEEE